MDVSGPAQLSLTLTTDRDGDTRLLVSAQASGFAGTTSFWGNGIDLSRFAAELSNYPLAADALIELVGGYGDWLNGSLEYEFVRLQVQPIGRLGQVRFLIHIAADESAISPSPAMRHEVHLELRTTYERLRRFSENLVAMAVRGSGEAHIEEEFVG